ncbi:Golgi phospho protein 3 [Hesseltinella vesiculosa]|uniref:Golgi phospho protein 3 n=1 Tax=Hesseltinella vesiculosa TaxID=101127 RepID=A0A1X2GCY6_9FUNG|nr:Golgi phospho protein 3 [Hesseltinella vesiculosa]
MGDANTFSFKEHLSFWNDTTSYALRACLLIDLALSGRIVLKKSTSKKLENWPVFVRDSTKIGEPVLDETLERIDHMTKPRTLPAWIDLLCGDVWLWTLIKYHLKHARTRLAEGLVSKGIIKTNVTSLWMMNYVTYPWRDHHYKTMFCQQVTDFLLMEASVDHESAWLRMAALISVAYLVNVLQPILHHLPKKLQRKALQRATLLLSQLSQPTDHLSPERQVICVVLQAIMEDDW